MQFRFPMQPARTREGLPSSNIGVGDHAACKSMQIAAKSNASSASIATTITLAAGS
jgi:hypothetical protein